MSDSTDIGGPPPERYHSLLKRQLRRHFGDLSAIPPQLRPFLDSIHEAYTGSDDDRAMVERSLELSSQELMLVNAERGAVLQAFPDVFLRVDADGTILECQTGEEGGLFLHPERLFGKRIQDIPEERIGRKFAAALRQVQETRMISSIEYAGPDTGTPAHYEARLVPLMDRQVIVIVRNITERVQAQLALHRAYEDLDQKVKARTAELSQTVDALEVEIEARRRMEEALRESESRFRRVIDSNMIGIFFWDLQGGISEANEAFLEIVGYSREDLQAGRVNWKMMTPPQHLESDSRAAGELEARGICAPYEKEYARKDGARVPVLVGAANLDGSRDRGVCFVIDINRRKRAEEELQRRASELARSNAELRQFAYVASHDLQEPLRNIAGFTQLLARRYRGKLDPDADEYIRFTTEGVRRMRQVILDLLEYARVDVRSSSMGAVDTGPLVARVLHDLEEEVTESGAQVSVGSLPAVQGDPANLASLFQNLIANAIKFRGEKPPQIRVEAVRQNGPWVFSIHDNGIGIDSQYHNRIFVIFQRLHHRETYPGTGVGLAICKKIVEHHGGRIWVESEAGLGAVFRFTLPACADVATRQRAA